MQGHLLDVTGASVSISTLCRTIKKYEFTRKKVEVIALQRSESLRIQFMAVVSMFSADMFIWIDETGSDRRKEIRRYGYSLRGIPPSPCQLRVSGSRISAIPVLTTRGIESVYTTTGTVNGDVFEDFVCKHVLPIIQPFNGVNPRSRIMPVYIIWNGSMISSLV